MSTDSCVVIKLLMKAGGYYIVAHPCRPTAVTFVKSCSYVYIFMSGLLAN